MSDKTKQFEDIRYVLKKEQKKPTPYAENRREAMIERVRKLEGDKAVREIRKEFKI